METKKDKPLKRDKNLVVFSHEHYQGLLFCKRLKKANRTNDEIVKRYILDFWNTYLVSHFNHEEKLFLPLFKEKQNKEIETQFLTEHQQLRTMIIELNSTNATVPSFAKQFAKLLTNHIRFEERKMFPWIQESFSITKLATIGNALNNIKIKAHQFTPQFWDK